MGGFFFLEKKNVRDCELEKGSKKKKGRMNNSII